MEAARENSGVPLRSILLLLLTLAAASAQEIRVVSEFQLADPFDRYLQRPEGSPDPREILSPAVPRGGFISFRIIVDPGPRANGILLNGYQLHVGVNPDNVIAVAVYREVFGEIDGQWRPVKLEDAKPIYIVERGSRDPLPNQKVHTYWVDIYVKPDAKPQRMKVQPEILVGNRWIEYPIELRLLKGVFPLINYQKETILRRSENRLSTLASAMAVTGELPAEPITESGLTPELLLRRNILQDALLWKRMKRPAREALLRQMGVNSADELLQKVRENPDPEYYLRFRDLLIGAHERE